MDARLDRSSSRSSPQRTSRIGLGHGGHLGLGPHARRRIALAAAGLQRSSGGRFSLGLGAGSPPLTEGFHGIAWEAPLARLRRTLTAVRALLAGERLPDPAAGARPLRLGVLPGGRRCRSGWRRSSRGRSGSPASWPTRGRPSCGRARGCRRDARCCDEGASRAEAPTPTAGRRRGAGGARARRRGSPASSRPGGWSRTPPAWGRSTRGCWGSASAWPPASTRSSRPPTGRTGPELPAVAEELAERSR